MTVKMGERGQDTGLKYKDGSPVHIGDLVAFDPDVWYKNNTREGATGHMFVVTYNNGEIQCHGSVSESKDFWSLVTKFDQLPTDGNCRVTVYDRNLEWIKNGKLIMPTVHVAYVASTWRLLNPQFFNDLPGAARWMVAYDHTDSVTFGKDCPLLIDLS